MKRERTSTNQEPPQVNIQPKQHHDRYSQTYSVPRALKFLNCILSQTEIDIIARIVHLTSRYLDKGGCNLSNSMLADRHECSQPVVSNAISKAAWLGIVTERSDEVNKYTDKGSGQTYVSQTRHIQMRIPPVWEIFGELWGEFYFGGDEDCGAAMKWAKERIAYYYKNKDEHPDWQQEFGEEIFKSSFRGCFKNFYPHEINLLGPPVKNFTLFIFTVLNSSNKILASSVSAEHETETPANSGNGNNENPSSSGTGDPMASEFDSKVTKSMFQKFWDLYPNHKGSKAKSIIAWDKLCAKPTKERPTWREVRRAIEAQKRSEQWKDPKYIPHATTWLNQRRWLDDPKQLVSYGNNGSSQNSKTIAPEFLRDNSIYGKRVDIVIDNTR